MLTDEKKKVLRYFAEGRKLYQLMDFPQARKYFDAALKLDPTDGPSAVFRERCDDYIQSPPPDDWDGVYRATSK